MTDAAPHTPRKRFGQHFLHERHVIERILLALDPRPGERIVEIGPGEGALTLPLLARHRALTAIEIDRDLIPRLRAMALGVGDLTIVEADALTVDLSALAAGGTLRLVGNLPYNISTPLLFHVLEHAAVVRDMHFMLQKEVVDRMAAGPGSKVYGRLSVMLQARCRVEPLFKVPPGAFRPPPKVDSAVVRLLPLPASEVGVGDPRAFDAVVRAGFSQRRKTLRNALQPLLDADAIAATGIDPGARAEDIDVAGWIALARAAASAVPHGAA
ncbi:MAG: 16S rRNA (adenine(1518)-N(6)/adenine(1519)-N(6))-dimethyltransferase RsmA [Xanthomonadaceae bacterium]|jgi:16S rRNA (adenine1518-N6/adenine1519-N6)-dimethyltransferase|nr:16S rRNA (adenine(1518)-N(6)/adenine(1519)-N(6))-dimethyltransferase RsmA [Xanthomonadaceae bacterium]